MKRLLSLMLAAAMIFSLLPNIVLADEADAASAETTASFSTDYPNTYTNTGNMAADIVGVAKTQVNYAETATNRTKYNYWFYNSDTAMQWCGIFIAWCADQAGIPTSIVSKTGLASGYSTSNMQKNPYNAPAYAFSSGAPQPGDIAFIAANGGSTSNHVGLVVGSDSKYIYTIEGNVSDTVGERKYLVSSGYAYFGTTPTSTSARILFYVRPAYEDNSATYNPCSKGHTWSDWTVTKGSTADSYTLTRTCTVCQESQSLTNPFEDVSNTDSYYYLPTLWAYAQSPQITTGTSETTFSPEDSCTRAQVVTFLWRAAGCPAHSNTECQFIDVSPSEYYYDAVLWAVENGITNGTGDTTFSPEVTVTRKEFVTFLWRYAGKASFSSSAKQFSDVADSSQFYYNAVMWAVENGITNGTSETEFSPDEECIRGQVVTFLYRYFNE